MMPRLFKAVAFRALRWGVFGILVAGLLIGGLRLALPFADLLRSELAGRLAAALGAEVRVERLELRLAGLTPRLGLRNMVLADPVSGRSRFGCGQFWIDLDPLASLWALAPRIRSVTLSGARLVVRQLSTGDIVVAGLPGPTGGDPEALAFFLGQGRFQLADSRLSWIDEQSGAPPLHFSGVRVRFENRGEGHRIGILARGLDGRPIRLRLVGDVRGEPQRPADWSGALYLQWQGRDLGQVLAGRLPAGLHLGSEAVTLESWSRLEAGRIVRSLNRIEVAGLRLGDDSGTADGPPWYLERMAGLLRWQRVGTGWRLAGRELTLTRDGVRRPASALGVRFTAEDDGGWTLAGGNRFCELADVRDLLTRLPWLPPEARHRLSATRPGGEVHDLRFRFTHRPGQPPRWAVSGRVEDLGLVAHGPFPGLRGLTAELAANQQAGRLVLADEDLVLELPRLFPRPLDLDRMAGTLRWRREGDGALRIGTEELRVGNADVATRSRFSLVLPATGAGPFLDLHTEFRDLALARVPAYLPSKWLRKKLVAWLERALVGGRVPAGALLFRGALADFPFDDQQGRFAVLFPVQDGLLDFHPEWSRLESIVGEARFENRGMTLSLAQGRLLDSDLVAVTARIPDLSRALAVEVRGRVEGPSTDGLRILDETPLRKRFGALARAFTTTGGMSVELDLSVPLRYKGRKGPLRVTGELSWPEPVALTLKVAERAVELTDLAGQLRFTERTLEAKSIRAKLWQVPIRLSLVTRKPGNKTAAATRIRAEGRFPTAVLARQFPSPRFWRSLEGRTPLALDLELPKANLGKALPPVDFTLTSELTGLTLRLPAPLGKSAAATRRLRLSGRLAPARALGLEGTYGDLGLNLGWDRGRDGQHRLARATLNLGGSPQPHPEPAGLHLTGAVADLDLGPWRDWWVDHKPPANGDPGGHARLRSVRVQVGHLRMDGTVLNDVDLALDHRKSHWQAQVKARELAGKATLPHRPRREPLRVRLARLNLKQMLGRNRKDDKTPADRRPTDPRRAHTLDLRIEQLRWGKNPLGSLTLRSQAVPDGLQFTTVALAGSHLSLAGQGRWRWTDKGPRSAFSLTADGRNLGRFLRHLEVESLSHQTPAKVKLDLGWPDAPGRFSAVALQGRIRVDLGAGRLLAVEPGVGRLLGLLNLGALRRRLALDFDDLFGHGYDFETLSGHIDIDQGTATIGKLLVEGPAADLDITGSTHLVTRELDHIITVTPHIGTGVAVASAVAGGPLVGAAVLAVDKVSGGAIDKLGRHQYHLRGPWTEPRIRRGSQP